MRSSMRCWRGSPRGPGAATSTAEQARIDDGARRTRRRRIGRSRVALLEEGVKVDTLRRDAAAVARRIEMIVAADHPTDRPAWLPAFRATYDAFYEDGEAKGINFSLSVAIELARRMRSHRA